MTKKRHKNLGDVHNFGRRVTADLCGKVFKPRPLVWEWLFLAKSSPWRIEFEAINSTSKILRKNFLPNLKFSTGFSNKSGWVQDFAEVLGPVGILKSQERVDLAVMTGQLMALAVWYGITDLHWENIILGRDKRRRLRLGLIDIEELFSKTHFPCDTQFLPGTSRFSRYYAGIHKCLAPFKEPVDGNFILQVTTGYLEQLANLKRHELRLIRALRKCQISDETPIRRLIRDSREYVLGSRRRFNPAEKEQLARGDIPYFWTSLESPNEIRWYTDSHLKKWRSLSSAEVTESEALQIFNPYKRIDAKRYRMMVEYDAIIVFSALNSGLRDGQFEFGQFELTLFNRNVTFKNPVIGEISSGLNWSARTRSVYRQRNRERYIWKS